MRQRYARSRSAVPAADRRTRSERETCGRASSIVERSGSDAAGAGSRRACAWRSTSDLRRTMRARRRIGTGVRRHAGNRGAQLPENDPFCCPRSAPASNRLADSDFLRSPRSVASRRESAFGPNATDNVLDEVDFVFAPVDIHRAGFLLSIRPCAICHVRNRITRRASASLLSSCGSEGRSRPLIAAGDARCDAKFTRRAPRRRRDWESDSQAASTDHLRWDQAGA